ncbi:hypothetical protein BV25DRAFT_1816894, partial [Artomyces pyxidatus]
MHQHLCANPHLPRYGARIVEKLIVLTVIPLVDLANSQARPMERVGIRAISLDSRMMSEAQDRGDNLLAEVQRCDWSVVLVSPERLSSPEFDKILRDKTFQDNLVLYTIDKAHTAGPWSKHFHLAYADINRVRARISPHVSTLLMSATLTLDTEKALLRMMGFQYGAYHTIHRSIEQGNMQLVFKTLHHGLGGNEFPDIAWVARCQCKVIIYCDDFPLCWRVASYLRKLWPLHVEIRRRNIRTYNGLSQDDELGGNENEKTLTDFCEDPETYVVVATIKFRMGVDLCRVQISINLGLPLTPEAAHQQNGCAVRDAKLTGMGINYVE